MQIGEASAASGVTAKMIRYYEDIGLIPSAVRKDSGYRLYDESDVHRLRFVLRARELGFSTERIRDLLRLWNDQRRPSREVKRLASERIAELEAQIARMQALRDTLKHLAAACDGDSRPHCPILRDLAGDGEG
ncbi:MAG: Cu(I)-responsive transcriptional regulator [Rhizobiales bacterium]|nr:Cu(I)-responsive transcriptional regulator [Hyphomicrobiales bacterium]MBI3671934.1 Cu(I)-responsive transcriptional regulator [Hyphomicrobiales bacterium]